MYKLYVYTPETVKNMGYLYVGSFETEQDCNQKAFLLGENYFRIEFTEGLFSTLLFETPFKSLVQPDVESVSDIEHQTLFGSSVVFEIELA